MSIDFSTFLNFTKKLQCQDLSKVIALIQNTICNNQSMYIQYHFLLSEKHKRMKSEYMKRNESIQAIEKYYEELTEFAIDGINESIRTNFKYLLEYFKTTRKSKYLPRLCVKSIHNDQVIDLYRFNPEYYNLHPVSEDTSIKHVQENGLYYLCNNIPLSAKEGAYKNPRLDSELVRKYKPSLFDRLKKDGPDEKWAACWKNCISENGESRTDVSSCYKSTLVVPMTLMNNSLSIEFQKVFLGRELKDNRTIFGFVCIDHLNDNYFDEENDIRVGYIFADLISLYFIALHIYTERSETFNQVSRLIESKG